MLPAAAAGLRPVMNAVQTNITVVIVNLLVVDISKRTKLSMMLPLLMVLTKPCLGVCTHHTQLKESLVH